MCDVARDDLDDSDPKIDGQISLGIICVVVDQLGVFQHDGAISNEGQIDCVVLWLDLSDRVKVTGMLKIVAIEVKLVVHCMNLISPPQKKYSVPCWLISFFS